MTTETQIKSEGLFAMGNIFRQWAGYIDGSVSVAMFLKSVSDNKEPAVRLATWFMANTKETDAANIISAAESEGS